MTGTNAAGMSHGVVFVRATDFSDQTMNMKTFDGARDLSTAFSREFVPRMFVLEATDIELAACYRHKEQLILIIEREG
jgi:hypothetical protein